MSTGEGSAVPVSSAVPDPGGRRTDGRRLVVAWGPVCVWMGLVTLFSSDHFSGAQTAQWLKCILHLGFPGLEPERHEGLNFVLRKMAHLVEYGILGGLLFRALRISRREWSLAVCVLVTLLIAAGWAGVDEFHQASVPSRTGSPWDGLIDTVGAGIGSGASWWWQRAHAIMKVRLNRS